jgi:hypothetical protein
VSAIVLTVVCVQLAMRASTSERSVARLDLLGVSPVVAAVAIGVTTVAAMSEWEDAQPLVMRRLRTVHSMLAAVGCALGAAPVPGLLPNGRWLLQNALLLLGLVLLGSVLLSPELSWIVPLAFAGACIVFGEGDDGVQPKSWALLLRPDHPWVMVLATGVGVIGGTTYVIRGPRRTYAPETM